MASGGTLTATRDASQRQTGSGKPGRAPFRGFRRAEKNASPTTHTFTSWPLNRASSSSFLCVRDLINLLLSRCCLVQKKKKTHYQILGIGNPGIIAVCCLIKIPPCLAWRFESFLEGYYKRATLNFGNAERANTWMMMMMMPA